MHLPTLHSRRVAPIIAAPVIDIAAPLFASRQLSDPAAESFYFPDHPPEVNNKTFDLYAYTRGLEGVNQNQNYLFVNVVVAFFLAIGVGFLILHFLKAANSHFRLTVTGGSKENQLFWTTNQTRWWPWLKRHIEYAPLFRRRHNREFQLSSAVTIGTLPSRFQTIVLVSYIVTNVAYMLVLPWNEPQMHSVMSALRGRSGILAAINLIPTVLFALRNNPLIWALNISYDTFNLFHRCCARMVIVESIVHAVCWFVNDYAAGGWDAIHEALTHVASYRWAMVGVCVMTFMSLQAWSPIRHAFYETFLNFHRILAFVAILGVYIHLDDHHLPQLPWVKIVFALWGCEWLARSAWLIYYNFSVRHVTHVHVEALPSEACRVTLKLARAWKPKPGAHVHLYIPSVSLWSSHPFSVAWSDIIPPELKNPSNIADVEKAVRKLDLESPDAKATSISLVCRARTGMTRQLYDRASAQPSRSFSATAFVEGPYPGKADLRSYGTVVLFAAGVGITHQVSYVRHLISSYSAGTSSTRRLVLVWSVANTEALEWVRPWMDEILKMPKRKDILRIRLFITKPRSHREVVSSTGSVQMFPGRCDPDTIVASEFRDRIGAMAVTVCGPGAFADNVKCAARKKVEDGVVDFIEEAFTY